MSFEIPVMSEDIPIQSQAGKENLKPTPKKKESTSKLIQDKIKEKLDGGFEIKDKHSVDDLKKTIIDELKLKKGWNTNVKTDIGKELTARDISIYDKGFKAGDLGGITVSMDKPAEPTITESSTKLPTLPIIDNSKIIHSNPHGTLPLDSSNDLQKQEPEKPVMTPAQIKMQEDVLKKMGGMVTEVMIGFGLVETDNEEEKKELEKPMSIKAHREKMDSLMVDLNQLLITYDFKMPKYFDIGFWFISFGSVVGIPIIKRVINGKKSEPEYDPSLDEVKVE